VVVVVEQEAEMIWLLRVSVSCVREVLCRLLGDLTEQVLGLGQDHFTCL
jgi:hypothetical protein